MTKNLLDSIKLSEHIARQLGCDCPIKTLYVDNCVHLAERIKTALSIVPSASYKVETVSHCREIAFKIQDNYYDVMLINEEQRHQTNCVDCEILQCPLIVIPKSFYRFNKWKLAYMLDDMIMEILHNHKQLPFNHLIVYNNK